MTVSCKMLFKAFQTIINRSLRQDQGGVVGCLKLSCSCLNRLAGLHGDCTCYM